MHISGIVLRFIASSDHYVDINHGIYKGKMKVAQNEKRKKLRGFSFSINITNFEAFLSVLKLTKNSLFLKSGLLDGTLPEGMFVNGTSYYGLT